MTRQTKSQVAALSKLQSPVSPALRHLVKLLQSVMQACAPAISFIRLDPNLRFRIGLQPGSCVALTSGPLRISSLSKVEHLTPLLSLKPPKVALALVPNSPSPSQALQAGLLSNAMHCLCFQQRDSRFRPVGERLFSHSLWTYHHLACFRNNSSEIEGIDPATLLRRGHPFLVLGPP